MPRIKITSIQDEGKVHVEWKCVCVCEEEKVEEERI